MKKQLLFSLLLHFSLLFLFGVDAIFRQQGVEIPNDTAIMVNFVKIGKVSQAPIIGTKAQTTSSTKKEVAKVEQKKSKDGIKEKSVKKTKESTKPIQLTPNDAQKANKFGLELVTSEASLIISKLKQFWNPPEIAENSGVKMRVFLRIDEHTGKILNYHIKDRTGPSEFYLLFENRIMQTVRNPEINFLALSEETRKMLGKRGLEVIFEANTDT
ncbi:MAG: hypothetical protein H6850_00420 [Alphaproteobacteria bacterium]|nr:MAG: hypothetical protein H6850_00420 [Alphaproteobacteria bacterium]